LNFRPSKASNGANRLRKESSLAFRRWISESVRLRRSSAIQPVEHQFPLQAGSAVLQAISVFFLGCSCEIEHQRRPPKVLGLTFFGSNPDSADTPLRSQVIQYVPVGGDGLSLKGSNWHATSRSIALWYKRTGLPQTKYKPSVRLC
jgi:hypothetical protein